MVKTPAALFPGDHRRQSDLMAAAADWTWTCGVDGRVDSLSSEFEASSGIASESLLGKHLSDLASHAEQRSAITAGKLFRDLVCKLSRVDGAAAWIEIAGTPIFEADVFRGYWGIGRTVTARVDDALALQRRQVKAEHALHKSEARVRQLFENASDWYWESDAKGFLTFISRNFEAMYGVKPEERIGKRLTDVSDVQIDPESGKRAAAAVKARQPYADFVYSLALPGGRTVWVKASAIPMFDDDGQFCGYSGMCKDITAQLAAERGLRDSEKRFKQLFEIASDYFWETDDKQRMTQLSPNYEAFFGVPLAEALGKRVYDIPGVSIAPEMGKMALAAGKARKPYRDFIYSRTLADGQKRWISVSGRPIFAEDGAFEGYRGVGADITARVEAEAAARLAKRMLHDAVAHVRQPLVVYDADSRIIAFNPAFADLHLMVGARMLVGEGVAFRELAQWQLEFDFYARGPDDEAIDLERLLARHLSEGEHGYHLRDGRWMLVDYRRLPGGGRVGVWTDITAIKRAEAERRGLEAQLHHSQRLEALGTLAGGAAHEINNALVPVIALSKMAAAKLPDGSRERRNLDTVVAGAERSRDLVKQILAFSRLEEIEVRRDRVDLAAVLRDALKLMRATVPTTIALAEDITPAPVVTGDPNQLHQVIVNLVTNAAQAIGEAHGRITVGLRRDTAGAARFWVMDTGCGMDEATKARIFEPFFTTKAVGKGTGLGLSVVHGIIKEHGGRIEIESTPGRGSRFDVILPAQAERAGVAA
jgi:PAS domain S-box-containing protein